MKVGFVGLGKLGLPVALAVEAGGHDVCGWDPSQAVQDTLRTRRLPYVEEGAQELLDETKIALMEPDMLAEWADLIFVAVQTPHQERFEGVTPLPDDRADFDYTYLEQATLSVLHARGTVVIISTVLPGTLERLRFHKGVLYNPFFIAMGTTIPDFRDPEFVLIGTDGVWPGPLEDLYESIHSPSVFRFVTTIRTAELTKVAYNTFIGLKIAFANTMMELCEKTGADVDDLVDALSLATKRIVSPAYMRGGMGDGGGCHPRDNIALSWLAREKELSFDLFGALMECRERQTEWLAMIAAGEMASSVPFKPIEILGKAYKPGTALTVGSPARLLAHMLGERGIEYRHTDPYADAQTEDRTDA